MSIKNSPVSKNQLKWIEISRSGLEHNIKVIRDVIGPEKMLMGIVKANSYGHDTSLIARTLLNSGVDYFGVVSLEEALELRNLGIRVPVFVIGFIPPENADIVCRYSVSPVVFSLEFAKVLETVGKKAGKVTNVTVKVETGMKRHGLQGRKLADVMTFLQGADYVKVTGLSTHFARSDEAGSEPTLNQLSLLKKTIDTYQGRGFGLFQSHAANSAATLLYPETHLDMVRCGIAMYGLYPSEFLRDSFEGEALRPVLELKTRIVQLQTVKKGEAVSYGGTWVADKMTRIAVLPVGYSDGYRRELSNCGHVIIRQQKAPVLGRVCMNLSMVDVTNIQGVDIGDVATLVSVKPEYGCSVDDIARHVGTINYEILSGLSPRIEHFLIN